jgi:hypothetical protein
MTCGFSIYCENLIPISDSKESRGYKVPEVKIIDLGYSSEIDLIVNAELKHQKYIFLTVGL